MIESQKSTSHGSNEANHSYKCNNIQIFITGAGAVGAKRTWGAVSLRKAQWLTTISTAWSWSEVCPLLPAPGLRGISQVLFQGIGLPWQSSDSSIK